MRTRLTCVLLIGLLACVITLCGCPNITGSGGVEGPTHAVNEDACIYLFKGDQWGQNAKLGTYVANQYAQGPLYGDGEGDPKVAVLEKGTKVQDRGAMSVTVNIGAGSEKMTVRYVAIMSGPQKDAMGWIVDDYLSSTGE